GSSQVVLQSLIFQIRTDQRLSSSGSNLEKKKIVFINVFKETNMLSQPVVVSNYLHRLVTIENQEKIDKVSSACLLNKTAQACAK
ncbi:hypothetical protein HAX54_012201, partial [Datura stramonium]|nr:hypothetical protein [Datura stramonium]